LVCGLVLVPATSAQAGYVSSDLVFAGAVTPDSEGASPFGLLRDGPALVVAGSSQSFQEQGPDSSDQSVPRAVKDRLAASLFCPGSGGSRPTAPVARKLPSSDVVFHAGSSAPPADATRLATYGNRVVVYHPCCDRLFRPPRSVGC
jgi:hypothetical protein